MTSTAFSYLFLLELTHDSLLADTFAMKIIRIVIRIYCRERERERGREREREGEREREIG